MEKRQTENVKIILLLRLLIGLVEFTPDPDFVSGGKHYS